MKHVIIGTAGHVDHGKSALVKALTGTDPDRLAEEKKRGITIELGFARLLLENGNSVDIIDVPGHEKFIKNMLMGAGGIHCVLLVVAANEGFMPQTREHLQILQLLGIRRGLIALTKCDLIPEDAIPAAVAHCRACTEGTFLADCPILPVSVVTGAGLPALRQALTEIAAAPFPDRTDLPFRLPIDRVFSVDGYGTVVTGTVTDGTVSIGDPIRILPGERTCHVRSLQCHSIPVDRVFAGQRAAVNLAGIRREELSRGQVIAAPDTDDASFMADVLLQNLPSSERTIRNHSQVHLYLGAAEEVAKVTLLDRDLLEPGDSCFAQIHLSRPLYARRNDRFVIRFFSPLETIGGGIVLDPAPGKHRRNDPSVLHLLELKLANDRDGEEAYLHELRYEILSGSVLKKLRAYHTANPLSQGMPESELCKKSGADTAFLEEMLAGGALRRDKKRYALPDFSVVLTPRQEQIRTELIRLYNKGDLKPPDTRFVYQQFAEHEKKDVEALLSGLIAEGRLTVISRNILYRTKSLKALTGHVLRYFEGHDSMTISQFKEVVPVSRKYAIAILQYLEREDILINRDGVRTRKEHHHES